VIADQLAALIDQAGRNLDTLELLARSVGGVDGESLEVLRARLEELRQAYLRETDALTQSVLLAAVERRMSSDRRQEHRRRF
jgi:hypothetical protein